MKRKWIHPEAPETGRQYWRSLGELEDSKDFKSWLEREFPQGAAELNADDDSRRNFIKLMGAATALAGFGVACSRPVRNLVPFNDHVEWLVPGKALFYATAKPRLGGRGCDPLVVTTYDGRPTKVDGNKLHPNMSGGSDAFTQASILDMYDPDRSRGYLKAGNPTVAADFEGGFLNGFREAASGDGVAFLISENSSPTRARLLADAVAKYAGSKVYSYDVLAGGSREAAENEIYGEGGRAVPNFEKAERVLSLDCDFMGLDKQGEDPVAEFARGRKVDDGGEMNRLYSVESGFTLTGGMADHRYRVASSQVLQVAALLAAEISGFSAGGVNKAVYNTKWISECAKDLLAAKGKALVVAGSAQPKGVHQLVAVMNAALGAPVSVVNTGQKTNPGLAELVADIDSGKVKTLFVSTESDPVFDAPADLNVAETFAKVPQVVHHGVRANLTAQQSTWHVPATHYLEAWGDFRSELGVYSVQQPMIRPMWGGVSEINFLQSLLVSPVAAVAATPAPAGEPVKEGEKAAAPVAVEAKAEVDLVADALVAVQETFKQVAGGADWNDVVRIGFAKDTRYPAASGSPSAPSVLKFSDLPHPEALEVNLVPGSSTYDGRFANNGWMQESPDPITKLTWDNAALLGFGTASRLGLEDGDMVEIAVGGRSIKAPVLRSPGQADYTLQLAVGYYGADEETSIGNVGTGVGFDVNPLRTTANPFVIPGATIKKLGYKHDLALTAEHYSMEGRALVREGTKDMFDEHDDFAQTQGMDAHIPEEISLYKGYDFTSSDDLNPTRNEENSDWALEGHAFRVDPNHQWAMTIDLHSCIGCNACSVACQAENNIPIVGKHQVLAGREMHWIRMDRYFTSEKDHELISDRGGVTDYAFGDKLETPGRRSIDDDAVEMITQPVACQQCEAAPCETVCPVNATVHSSDGLNAMTYNRCIGTRYCANNCPYKARRFNYFDYNKRPLDKLYHGPLAPAEGHATTSEQLQKNPNVTVRMRGVIEKCTYCVQRISKAKIGAKVAARDSADVQVKANSLTVACQDACPAGAIDFGNLMNEKDSIVGGKNNPRNYDLLKYIGTRPRTSYLARIKNPNPAMPGADKVGVSTSKMH
ncbi:MAG: TAT-variant-translocated molybdopterin oxidoreductase [Verrucomicrobiales bacterium]